MLHTALSVGSTVGSMRYIIDSTNVDLLVGNSIALRVLLVKVPYRRIYTYRSVTSVILQLINVSKSFCTMSTEKHQSAS